MIDEIIQDAGWADIGPRTDLQIAILGTLVGIGKLVLVDTLTLEFNYPLSRLERGLCENSFSVVRCS